MKRSSWGTWKGALVGVVGGAALALAGVGLAGESDRKGAETAARVERGRYLVATHACNDCHTPMKMGPKGPEVDASRLLSGHPESTVLSPAPAARGSWVMSGDATGTAFAGPWGVSYTANLTPDVNTGLGIWSEDMFIRALRTGKHFGTSRPIMPPMPWKSFGRMSDEELKSIYAYLRTIPPVTNHVPDYQPAAPTTASN